MPTQFGKHFWPNFSFVYGIRVDYLSPTFYFTDFLVILILIFFIFENRRRINKHLNLRKNLIKIELVFLTFLILITGIINSINPLAGVYGFVKLTEVLFLISYTAKNFRNANRNIVFSCFVFGVFFESVLVILQYLNQGSLGGVLYYLGERSFNAQTPGIANASINGNLIMRPYGTFSHPNVLSAYLFVLMYLIIVYIKKETLGFKNIIAYLTLLLGTLSLILTMSRVSIFAWVLLMFVFLAMSFWKKTRISFLKTANFEFMNNKKLILLLFATIVFLYLSPSSVRFFETNFSDQTFTKRQNLIKDASLMVYKSPALGTGLNNFLTSLPAIQKQQGQQIYLQPVHNIFFLVLSETGVIIFMLFLYFLFLTFNKIREQKNNSYLILFFSILFLSIFDHYFFTLQQGQILFAIVFGIFWSETKEKLS